MLRTGRAGAGDGGGRAGRAGRVVALGETHRAWLGWYSALPRGGRAWRVVGVAGFFVFKRRLRKLIGAEPSVDPPPSYGRKYSLFYLS